jgi:hypothetical protein
MLRISCSRKHAAQLHGNACQARMLVEQQLTIAIFNPKDNLPKPKQLMYYRRLQPKRQLT